MILAGLLSGVVRRGLLRLCGLLVVWIDMSIIYAIFQTIIEIIILPFRVAWYCVCFAAGLAWLLLSLPYMLYREKKRDIAVRQAYAKSVGKSESERRLIFRVLDDEFPPA